MGYIINTSRKHGAALVRRLCDEFRQLQDVLMCRREIKDIQDEKLLKKLLEYYAKLHGHDLKFYDEPIGNVVGEYDGIKIRISEPGEPLT